jgi:signal transduction histidine kinase
MATPTGAARVPFILVALGAVLAGVGVRGMDPAGATERPIVAVAENRPATAQYPPIAPTGPSSPAAARRRLVPLGATYYPSPQECGGQQCDAIPLDVVGPLLPRSLLVVSFSWQPQSSADFAGAGLIVALWRSRQGSFSVVDADQGRGFGNAVVRLEDPVPGRYVITVAPAESPPTAQFGYGVRAEVKPARVFRPDPGDTAAPRGPTRDAAGAGAALHAASPVVRPAAESTGLPPRPLALRPVGAMPGHESAATRLRRFVIAMSVVAVGIVAIVFGPRRRRLVSQGASMRARLASRFANLRLFWKLLVPFVAVILVIGLSGAYLTVHYLASRASTTLDQSLLERSVGAETYLRDSELYLLEAERFAANLEGVPEATAAHNASDLSRALASAVAVRKDLDVLAATDAAGLGLVDYVAEAGTFAAHAGTQWSAAPAVAQVLSGVVDATGDKRTSLVRLGDSSVLLLTAGPIRTDAVVGAAVAGISAEKLAAGAARRARGRVALYDPSGARMAASRGGLAARLPAGATRGAPLRTRHGGIATLYSPLVIRGARVGTVATAIPTGGAFSSVRGAAMRLALLVALAMAAIVGFGVAVSRSILRSVEPLVATNRALGAGDLSVRAPVRGGDELGELASGFNLMAEQLQASYGELERRVEERTEELSRLYADNVRATEARSQFFATISHEFRTPLFAILANAELMADPALGPATPAELAESTATISTSARVLLERVNEILELASAESTGIDINVAPLDMAETWADLEPTVAALARAGELDLTSSVPTDLPPVAADDTRLRQIISNLASNAVKYTPAGGRVAVSARLHGDVVEVAVTDTGVGIPRSVGDKVFEPYYRVKGSRAQGNWASTGLGLALTRRLVEAHGGRIWFRSARPGTTFFFTLPVAAKPTRAKARRG